MLKKISLLFSVAIASVSYALVDQNNSFEESEINEAYEFSFSVKGTGLDDNAINALTFITGDSDVAIAIDDLARNLATSVKGKCSPEICEIEWTEKDSSGSRTENKYGAGLGVIEVGGGYSNGQTKERNFKIKVPCKEVSSVVKALTKKDD